MENTPVGMKMETYEHFRKNGKRYGEAEWDGEKILEYFW